MYFFFFFKQKTAYEMRISDWSSDVCSSDLIAEQVQEGRIGLVRHAFAQPVPHRRHVGKEAQMPKRRALGGEARLAPRERPAFGGPGLVIIPASATLVVRCRDEISVGGFTFARQHHLRPHTLRHVAADDVTN